MLNGIVLEKGISKDVFQYPTIHIIGHLKPHEVEYCRGQIGNGSTLDGTHPS